MAEPNSLRFEVVRRGYDVDEVNDHLTMIERQRQVDLENSQKLLKQRDDEIARLQALTAEVEDVNRRRAELDRLTSEASQKREAMLEEASRTAREQATMASQSAAGLRSETEREMSNLRRQTESEMAELQSSIREKVDKRLDEARSEARRIEADARDNAQRIETETLKRLAEFEAGHQLELEHRRNKADRDHSAAMRAHRQSEDKLSAQVNRLQELRDSLVDTLNAIAHGGLTAMDSTPIVPSVADLASESTGNVASDVVYDPEVSGVSEISETSEVGSAELAGSEVDEPVEDLETDIDAGIATKPDDDVDIEAPHPEIDGEHADHGSDDSSDIDSDAFDSDTVDSTDLDGPIESDETVEDSIDSDADATDEVTAGSFDPSDAAETVEYKLGKPDQGPTPGKPSKWRLISAP